MPIKPATGFTLTAVGARFVISAMLVWSMAGFFYETDLRQRLAMAAVLPLFGMAALPHVFILSRAIFN